VAEVRGLLLIVLIFLQVGCASWNKRTLAYMGGSFLATSLAGALQAPDGEDRLMHAAQWGGIGAAAVGAVMVATHDESKDFEKKQKEIEDLKIRLSVQDNKKAKNKGNSDFLESSLPGEVRHLIKPGSWKLFEIDEWKESDTGEFVHSDRVLEFSAPKVQVTK